MKLSLDLPMLLVLVCMTTACAPPPAKTKVSGGNCSAETIEHLNRMSNENYSILDSGHPGLPDKFQAECRMVKELMKGTSGCSSVDQSNAIVLIKDSDVEQFCSYDPYVFSKQDGTRLRFRPVSTLY